MACGAQRLVPIASERFPRATTTALIAVIQGQGRGSLHPFMNRAARCGLANVVQSGARQPRGDLSQASVAQARKKPGRQCPCRRQLGLQESGRRRRAINGWPPLIRGSAASAAWSRILVGVRLAWESIALGGSSQRGLVGNSWRQGSTRPECGSWSLLHDRSIPKAGLGFEELSRPNVWSACPVVAAQARPPECTIAGLMTLAIQRHKFSRVDATSRVSKRIQRNAVTLSAYSGEQFIF